MPTREIRDWQLRQQIAQHPKTFGEIERAHRRYIARLQERGASTEEINQAKMDFRQKWIQSRAATLDAYADVIEQWVAAADPMPSGEELSRMRELSEVYGAGWRANPEKLRRDAERFVRQGDVAGLKAAKEHAELLPPEQRTEVARVIDEALDAHKPEAVRHAEQMATQLYEEAEDFQTSQELRESFIFGLTETKLVPVGPERPSAMGIVSDDGDDDA